MNEKQHIAAFDYLRTIGVLAVVLIHAFSLVLFNFEPVVDWRWWIGNLVASSTHWAVPVFLMVSGALHLGKELGNIKNFYLKKVKRLLIPLALSIAFFAFVYTALRGDTFYLSNILWRLVFDQPYEHLYFLIVLFFLFLITPLLNYLLNKYPQLFKVLFGISLFYSLFVQPTRFIGLFWIPFLSYYLAGYYLNSFRKINNRILLLSITFSIILTMIGTALLTTHVIPNGDGFYLFGIPSPLTIVLSYSIFLLFKQLFESKSSTKQFTVLSDSTFGIYLIHPFFLLTFSTIFFSATYPKSTLYVGERFILFVLTFLASLITVYFYQNRKNWFSKNLKS